MFFSYCEVSRKHIGRICLKFLAPTWAHITQNLATWPIIILPALLASSSLQKSSPSNSFLTVNFCKHSTFLRSPPARAAPLPPCDHAPMMHPTIPTISASLPPPLLPMHKNWNVVQAQAQKPQLGQVQQQSQAQPPPLPPPPNNNTRRHAKTSTGMQFTAQPLQTLKHSR